MDKYIQWYNQIVQNGKQLREGYTECHHIIPPNLRGQMSTLLRAYQAEFAARQQREQEFKS